MDIDKWLEGLDDEKRAEVLRTHITETEQTKRTLANSENFQTGRVVRTALVSIPVLLIALATSCTVCEKIYNEKTVKLTQIQAEHPAVVPAAPSTSK